jgi:hypothetical protein
MKKLSRDSLALFFIAILFHTALFVRSGLMAGTENVQVFSPTIASISPTSGPAGSQVNIKGAHFAAAGKNSVYFGPVRAKVESATSSSLSVVVPAGAAYGPIKVTADSLIVYSSQIFTPTFPSRRALDMKAFAAKVDLQVWGSIGRLAAGDLDGDGKIDLVTTSNMGVTVFRNTSQGMGIDSTLFVERVDLPGLSGGDWVTDIVLDDLNGDSKLDVVTVIRSANVIALFLNTSTAGTLSFAPRCNFAVGESPQEAATGDLDGDGKLDIVVSNSAGGWGTTVSILRNRTIGNSLNFDAQFQMESGSAPYGVCLRDMDGDFRPDIVVANKNDAFVSIFRNVSTSESLSAASFEAKSDFPLPEGGGAYHVAPCDIDGDGKIDLALAHGGSGYTVLSLLRNASTSGHLGFDPQVVLGVPKDSRDVAVSDLDGDARVDLAACSWEENAMSILRNISESGTITSNSFQECTNFTAGNNPVALLIADFDLDRRPDVAVGNFNNGTISIFRNIIAPPVTDVAGSNAAVHVNEFRLAHNYPNPFNSSTKLSLEIPQRGRVALRVFNLRGDVVKTLLDSEMQAGTYEAVWDGGDEQDRGVPSGVYIFRVEADGFSQSSKALLLK